MKYLPWDALGQAEGRTERMYTSVSLAALTASRSRVIGPLKAMTRAPRVLDMKASS